MRKIGKRVLVFIFTTVTFCASAIVPMPKHYVQGDLEGSFEFNAKTQWVLSGSDSETDLWGVVEPLSDQFERVSGYKYQPTYKRAKRNFVEIKIDNSLAEEEYKLQVGRESIAIAASGHKGLFYALQTIRQLLPKEIESREAIEGVEWRVPLVEIEDRPSIGYRGFMIDVSRYFVPKDRLLEIIDVLGLLKINVLHLHLVDDNGWRIEIKKYPKLTEVGAWSVDRDEYFSARTGPKPGEPTTKGGFYTQDDIREIVEYAAKRAIEVIPEIEMPAHTMGSLAAYPEMACSAEDQFIGVLPGYVGYNNYTPTYCAGKEEVYSFLEDILLEVMELFPSKYIHVGGDEAPTEYWAKCEHCQKIMQREGYSDPHMMQSYFMKRMGDFIESRGKVLVGWDELVDSPMPENAVIVGWRGDGRSAFKAAELGHKFVMAPAQKLYFIRYQGPQWFEPKTFFGNITLKDVYEYKHLPDDASKSVRDNFLGTQACLWSEFVNSVEDAHYLIFPRLMAHSENSWADQDALDWGSFVGRLDLSLERLNTMGIQHARSMYNLDHKVVSRDGKLAVEISSIRPDVEIRYTLKNRVARAHDDLWSGDMMLSESATIAAAAFRDGVQLGQTLLLPIEFNKATAKSIRSIGEEASVDLLVNGVRGSDKLSDFEWCRWYIANGAFVVDLDRVEHISTIALGTIMDNTLAVGRAKRVVVSYSVDGDTYRVAAEYVTPADKLFEQVISVDDIVFSDLNIEARYIKVEAENPGKISEEFPRGGQECAIYFDEIIIN